MQFVQRFSVKRRRLQESVLRPRSRVEQVWHQFQERRALLFHIRSPAAWQLYVATTRGSSALQTAEQCSNFLCMWHKRTHAFQPRYLLKSTSELEATRCYTTGTTFASSYSFENRRLSQSCCACASGADVDSDAAAVLAKAAQGCLEGLVLCAVTLPATAGGRIRLKEEPRSILGRYLGLYRASGMESFSLLQACEACF